MDINGVYKTDDLWYPGLLEWSIYEHTALAYAIKTNNRDMMQFLLENGPQNRKKVLFQKRTFWKFQKMVLMDM